MKTIAPLYRFNHGVISPLALARVDVKRVALGAAESVNWVPRALGSMMPRVGLGFVGEAISVGTTKWLRFIYAKNDTAFIEANEFTGATRVWVNEAVVVRVSAGAAITGGTFPSGASFAANWNPTAGPPNTAAWISAGRVSMVSDGSTVARMYQTVVNTSPGTEQGIRVIVERGPVTIRIGSTAGDDDYFTETVLGTGSHSIGIAPAGNFTIWFQSTLERLVILNSVTIEAAGDMVIPSSRLSAAVALGAQNVVYTQSGDILFLALGGYQQMMIKRLRADSRSWSIEDYAPIDGPFRGVNTTATTLSASAISGNITLSALPATAKVFKSTNVGSLYRLTSSSQIISATLGALNAVTNPIQVAGVGEARRFTYQIVGTGWTGTATLQRSIGVIGTWEDVTSFTTDTTDTLNDGLDNQVIYYRIKMTAYVAGSIVATLTYQNGSITGVVRITAVASAISASAEVLIPLGDTNATDIWYEGSWSDRSGWPTADALYEGRLWWSGKNGVWGSVSDTFDTFDPDTVGDSGPINRQVGAGPVDIINWILPMQRLLLGAQGAEVSVRSTTFDEPLTPTNFNAKEASTQGSARVQAEKIDSRGIFIQKSGVRVYQLAFDTENFDYGSQDLTALCPELGSPEIIDIAIQRQPDTRIHCVRSDGTVMLGVVDRVENVLAWQSIETDGFVEAVLVFPGDVEDKVYYVVVRRYGPSGPFTTFKRYVERWALESQCIGGDLNRQADSYAIFASSTGPTTIITGLDHLEDREVVAWGDGKDLSPIDTATGLSTTYTVTGGQITVPTAVSNAIAGLPYVGDWESVKLAVAAQQQGELTLGQRKRITQLGLILANTHIDGVRHGPDFDHLEPLPKVQGGKAWPYDTVFDAYDFDLAEFRSTWDTDARLCLRAQAPRPTTVLAAMMAIEGGGKS